MRRRSLQKNLDKIQKESGAIKGRLSNEKFVAKAPDHVVAEAREQVTELEAQADKVNAALARLS